MKGYTAVFLLAVLTLGLVTLTGAAVQNARDGERRGSFCPNGAACQHQLDHDAAVLWNDAIRRAEIAMARQMTELERAIMVAAGVPSDALR